MRTKVSPLDLLTDPTGVTALLARWPEKLAGVPQAGRSDSPTCKGYRSRWTTTRPYSYEHEAYLDDRETTIAILSSQIITFIQL